MKTWLIVVAIVGTTVAAPQQSVQPLQAINVQPQQVIGQIPPGGQVVYLQPAAQPYVPQSQVYYVQAPALQTVQYVKKPSPLPPVKVTVSKPPQVTYTSPVKPVAYKGEGAEANSVIIKQVQDDNFDGNFNYNFETSNEINVQAVGALKNAGTEDEIQVISGSYSYVDPEGNKITVTYNADENGFVAQGDHLPVPPPIPEAIAKSLEYLRSLPLSTDSQRK